MQVDAMDERAVNVSERARNRGDRAYRQVAHEQPVDFNIVAVELRGAGRGGG